MHSIPDNNICDRIYALWDALADRAATDPDGALNFLLSALCELADAQNANWFGAVHLPDIAPGDPVNGWRPRFIHYLHPLPLVVDRANALLRKIEAGKVDISSVRNVALAGTFRCNRLVDLVPPEWFSSEFYRVYYRALGHHDIIWSGIPVSAGVEAYIGLFRDLNHPPFSVADRVAVGDALRGLKWFFRQLLLSRGLLAASAPLSTAERKVLQALLGGLTEKEIAVALNQSPNTTHTHVTSIYRKFCVKNRAMLTALWLGKAG